MISQRFTLHYCIPVEIAASGGVLGGLATVASAIVIHRYGYRACYLASTALILSSGAFMWMASMYKPFFGHWIGFVSLFLMLGGKLFRYSFGLFIYFKVKECKSCDKFPFMLFLYVYIYKET